jgi:hypothetical protein
LTRTRSQLEKEEFGRRASTVSRPGFFLTILRTKTPCTFNDYQKLHNLEHAERAKDISGLNATCNWLSQGALFRALFMVGFKVLKVVDDSNFLAWRMR